MRGRAQYNHPACPGGCGELADECACPRPRPLGSMTVTTSDPNPYAGRTPEERQERYDRAVEHGKQINATLRATLSGGRTAEFVLPLEHALAEASRWLDGLKQRGIDLTAQAHRKTVHEAVELAENPCLEEWADVAICLMGVALAQGWHYGDLADAIQAKVAINAHREWKKRDDGTFQHAPESADRAEEPT